MKTIQNNIKYYMEKNEISYSILSNLTGIAKSTLQRYATGTTVKIPVEAVEKIETALNLSKGTLMGWQDDTNALDLPGIKPVELKKFRMLGKIACGEPIYANEEYNTYVEADATIDADFCLTAQGDSMINANIQDGDIVFIKEMEEIPNGRIAAVLIEDEVMLKRFYKTDDTITLISENPHYEPKTYHKEQHLNIRILGKAVCVQHDLK